MPARKRKTILVVDDDRELRAMVSLMLERAGYKVRTARNGREALEEVSRVMPDLIILDMQMPVMTGWEFARHFHSSFDSRAPIVVLTASETAHERGAEVGAREWIRKPFDVPTLLSAVRSHTGD